MSARVTLHVFMILLVPTDVHLLLMRIFDAMAHVCRSCHTIDGSLLSPGGVAHTRTVA